MAGYRLSTPVNSSVSKKEVTATARGSPDRWHQRDGTVGMRRDDPARTRIRQDTELNHRLAAAWTDHRDLPFLAVLTNNVDAVLLKTSWKVLGVFVRPPCLLKQYPGPEPPDEFIPHGPAALLSLRRVQAFPRAASCRRVRETATQPDTVRRLPMNQTTRDSN